MPIAVRRAAPEEWEALKEVRLAALRESPDAFGSTYEREARADEATWRRWITGEGWDGAVATFVAEEEGRLLGMATAYGPDDEPGTHDQQWQLYHQTASAKRARSCLVVGTGTERVVRQPLLRVRLISVIDPHHVWGVRKVA